MFTGRTRGHRSNRPSGFASAGTELAAAWGALPARRRAHRGTVFRRVEERGVVLRHPTPFSGGHHAYPSYRLVRRGHDRLHGGRGPARRRGAELSTVPR